MKKPPKAHIADRSAKLLEAIKDIADTIPEPRKSQIIQLALNAGGNLKQVLKLIS